LLKGLIRWLVHIHYNLKARTKTEYSTLILNKRWIWTSHLMRSLTLYPRLGRFRPIRRKFAENKGSMRFKNSKSTFCSKLHGLSTSKKNIFFHCATSEIYDL
jgi:hypothetical protein